MNSRFPDWRFLSGVQRFGRAVTPALKDDVDVGIVRVLGSGRFVGGPEVAALERELAEYVGVKHCITCGNGTDALQLALMAWGVGPGDAGRRA